MPTTTRKARKKRAPSKRKCSVCSSTEHTKRNCLQSQQLELVPEEIEVHKLVVQSGPKTGKAGEPLEGEVLKKCKFPSCRSHVDETGYGPYCTQTCSFFDRKRIHAMAESKDKYQEKFAEEDFMEYLKECERSHLPLYAKVDETLVPIRRVQIPSVAGFASYLGFAKVTLKSWAAKHDEFRKAMLYLKQIQEYYLTNNGGVGVYNSNVVKLMLMNNHGMKDRSERTVNHLFGIVREVYEQADAYEQDGALEDPFEGVLGIGASEDDDVI